MKSAHLWKALLCTSAIACAALPALGQEAESESCVGKVRLRGPLWDLQGGTLEPGLGVILDEVARTIRSRCAQDSIVIEAHAFELPSAELNLLLSELRAATVRHELVKRGVPFVQLLPIGVGDTRPLVPKDDPDYALENRRVTFRVLD
jgi:outer membrane protein OmpA-like peptidoglycan-associated protein